MRLQGLCSAILVLIAGTASAQTYVTANIESDQTWIADFSPYVIQADILVGNHADLLIEPGVTVAFDGEYHLEIGWQSRIFATGTHADPVVFTSNAANPAMRDWEHIKVSGPDPSAFDHCIFEYADIGVWLSYIDTPISNCVFRESRMAVHCEASSPLILGSTFTRCQIGIHLTNNLSRPVIHWCNLFDNSAWNIQIVLYPAPDITIDATNNWWGTEDPTLIAQSIHDHLDDDRLHATIDFDPWRGSVPILRTTWGGLKALY